MDRCRRCGSDSLFSAFFTTDGLAEPDDSTGARWGTMCNDFGEFQDRRKRTR